ncbi:hypothetical protein SteCoe_1712 [Stentor coeruleus]|uniref:Transmembrane protein n=1 Tax=Stentor coeruleus TaxID=5963 RepID=A0A1R2D179_9CILI|nr:hypothetical protein SteCoe_1712 [Stentor coeruleus]
MIFGLFIYGFLSLAQQLPFNYEIYSDPVCNNKGPCNECLFSELRQIDSCYETGFIQKIYCTMTSNLNNTQDIFYISSCQPKGRKSNNFFTQLWAIFIALTALLYYNWQQLKSLKTKDEKIILESIINT